MSLELRWKDIGQFSKEKWNSFQLKYWRIRVAQVRERFEQGPTKVCFDPKSLRGVDHLVQGCKKKKDLDSQYLKNLKKLLKNKQEIMEIHSYLGKDVLLCRLYDVLNPLQNPILCDVHDSSQVFFQKKPLHVWFGLYSICNIF